MALMLGLSLAHMASMLGLGHATWCLGYDMPHGTYVMLRPCHGASMKNIGHATCVRPRPCDVASM